MRATMKMAAIALALVVLTPTESQACPICFGADPDSPIAQGLNWAVFSLLGVTGGVLSGFVAFMFHLMKHSRQALGSDTYHAPAAAVQLPATSGGRD